MTAFEPIIIDGEEPDVDDGEQILLFSIRGTDYFMPAKIPPSVGAQALDMIRHEGEVAGSMWLLEEVLGSDGYQAYISCRAMTSDQMKRIANTVQEHVFGQMDDTGNGQGPNRAVRRSGSRGGSSNGHSGGAGSSTTKRTSTRTSGASTGSPRSKRRTS